jgi:hypothetical protein
MDAIDKEKVKLKKAAKKSAAEEAETKAVKFTKELQVRYDKDFATPIKNLKRDPSRVWFNVDHDAIDVFISDLLIHIEKNQETTNKYTGHNWTKLWKDIRMLIVTLSETISKATVSGEEILNPETEQTLRDLTKKFNTVIKSSDIQNVGRIRTQVDWEKGSGVVMGEKQRKVVVNAFNYGKFKTEAGEKQFKHFNKKSTNDLLNILHKVRLAVKKMNPDVRKLALKHVSTVLIVLIQRNVITESKARTYYTSLYTL